MRAADPERLISQWVKQHSAVLKKVLGALGVHSPADRADLSQEVFCTAFLFLEHGNVIENPPAFLYECARKHASNYRRKMTRPAYRGEDEPADVVATPEQIVSAHEVVEIAFENLDEKARSILFEVADGGSTWGEMARARGITVDQARYLHERAVARVAELARPELKRRKRSAAILLPATLDKLFGSSLTGNAERTSGFLHDLWGFIERQFKRGSAGAAPELDQEGEQSLHAGPERSPRSGSLLARSAAIAPSRAALSALGVLTGGLAGGLVIGSLLRGNLPEGPQAAPARVAAQVEQAPSAPLPAPPVEEVPPEAPAARRDVVATSVTPARRSAPARQGSSSGAELTEREQQGSMTLIDRARRDYGRGDLRGALALLAQHERRFPVGPDTERRHLLTRLVCSAPTGASECAKAPRVPGL